MGFLTFLVPMVVPIVANLIDGLGPVANWSHPPKRLAVECAVVVIPGPDRSGFVFCCFVLVIVQHLIRSAWLLPFFVPFLHKGFPLLNKKKQQHKRGFHKESTVTPIV